MVSLATNIQFISSIPLVAFTYALPSFQLRSDFCVSSYMCVPFRGCCSSRLPLNTIRDLERMVTSRQRKKSSRWARLSSQPTFHPYHDQKLSLPLLPYICFILRSFLWNWSVFRFCRFKTLAVIFHSCSRHVEFFLCTVIISVITLHTVSLWRTCYVCFKVNISP